MARPICVKDYHLSSKTGFLVENPQEYLPDYFEPWNRLARIMPDLVGKRKLREAVKGMQLLDYRNLSGYRQHRLAHLQLAIIASGYVWQEGETGVPQRLPGCIAIPLWKISEFLGLKPVLSHADLFLANWKYTNDERDIEPLYILPGREGCQWFCKVTSSVELTFAKGVDPLQTIIDGLVENDKVKVTTSLRDIAEVINGMVSDLQKMHDKLSGDTFYNTLRPFMSGWGGESSPLPKGLIYEGISDEPVKVIGVTAAQSTTLQVLDILLGVSHQPDKKAFLNEMRNYMPPSHKQLLVDMENMPKTLTNMVSEYQDKELMLAYNKCLEAVKGFRSYHIQLVTKYIVVASKKNKQENNKNQSLANKGTGGTDLLPFLKELRNDTNDKIYASKQ